MLNWVNPLPDLAIAVVPVVSVGLAILAVLDFAECSYLPPF